MNKKRMKGSSLQSKNRKFKIQLSSHFIHSAAEYNSCLLLSIWMNESAANWIILPLRLDRRKLSPTIHFLYPINKQTKFATLVSLSLLFLFSCSFKLGKILIYALQAAARRLKEVVLWGDIEWDMPLKQELHISFRWNI